VAVGSVPGTATDDASVGTISWTNPGNALVRLESAGEAYAVATALPIVSGTSHYLFISNLGLSIPSNATITGVRALVWAKTSAGTVAANSLKILKTGAVTGTEEATNFKAVAATGLFTGGTTLNTSDTVLGFGGDGVMWGATLAYSDVNNSGFGVALSFKNTHASVTATVSIDYLQVTVYYTQPTLPNDFSNRPRPAGGNVLAAVGILDRHDAAVLNASITDGTNHSWQLTAWDDFDFQVAIPSTATQVSIKCQYDNNYDTTLLPQVTILNGGGCGVADQTIVATTAAHNAWETETFTIAPTSAGVLTVRIQGRSIGVTGKCFFATGPRVS
jgi:hypothetical protein